MKNFLIEHYILLTKSFEILAAITGIVVYKNYKHSPAKYFIFFLIYVALLELVGGYVRQVRPDKSLHFLMGTLFEKNYWLYNLGWHLGAILFFVFYYYKVLKTKSFKTLLKNIGYFYLCFSIVYIFSNGIDFFYKSFIILKVTGAIIIFTCCALYFIELLQSQKILLFFKSLSFYITVVILIWWLIITPLSFYDVYYSSVDLSKPFRHPDFFGDLNYATLKKRIYLFSNTFMYLTYTFALIWCRPQKI
ncbi:hypothetical protein GCM10022291_25570 [Postechiella marina]|uniref:Uncharacterized protein n=1 Tax=Postechiella marina TaxID=943941 RepID=A0ABP8CDJ4_9FLAO